MQRDQIPSPIEVTIGDLIKGDYSTKLVRVSGIPLSVTQYVPRTFGSDIESKYSQPILSLHICEPEVVVPEIGVRGMECLHIDGDDRKYSRIESLVNATINYNLLMGEREPITVEGVWNPEFLELHVVRSRFGDLAIFDPLSRC